MSEEKLPEYLYRYMSFESFIDLVQTSNLVLVKPELWEDKYETHAFFRSVEKLEGIFLKQIPDNFKSKHPKKSKYKESIIDNAFCQCWTENRESIAMWDLYEKNKISVKIKVSSDKFRKFSNILLCRVRYVENIDTFITDVFSDDIKVINLTEHEIMSVKRDAFSYEREFRIIKLPSHKTRQMYVAYAKYEPYFEWSEPTPSYISETEIKTHEKEFYAIKKHINDKRNKKIYKLLVEEAIDDFLEEVEIDPRADDWIIDTVKTFCANNGISGDKVRKSTLLGSPD